MSIIYNFQKWGPCNNGNTCKEGKISYMGYKLSFFKLTPRNVGKICKKGKIQKKIFCF